MLWCLEFILELRLFFFLNLWCYLVMKIILIYLVICGVVGSLIREERNNNLRKKIVMKTKLGSYGLNFVILF